MIYGNLALKLEKDFYPPYNTGSKDFIYDDDYVDENDSYRHSKWLSFMSSRLNLSQKLLSAQGTIVISIGYHEVHNLMILCQEIFSNKQVTCVTVQTSGGKPNGGFTYVHEYLVFVTSNDFQPTAMSFTGGIERSPFEGFTLSTFDKNSRPNQVYPIFIDRNTMSIVGMGKSLKERIDDGIYIGDTNDFEFDYDEGPEGTATLWPVSSKGAECVWRLISKRLKSDWDKGYIKVSKNRSKSHPNEFSIQYLPEGVINKVENNELKIEGKEEGVPTLKFGKNQTVGSEIPTIWTEKDFYTTKGSTLVKKIFGEKKFQYPKSLDYIIEILRATTPVNGIVLDFFAGSGTTGEAVLNLNKMDNGKRKFILCTNNQNDICQSVTYPRMKTVITGECEDGSHYDDNIPANLKYYRTEFISKSDEFVSNELIKHIAEMIQLECGVKLEDKKYIIILSDDEVDKIAKEWKDYTDVKAMYVSKDVLFTTHQKALFKDIEIHIIPDDYFNFELREVGEAW